MASNLTSEVQGTIPKNDWLVQREGPPAETHAAARLTDQLMQSQSAIFGKHRLHVLGPKLLLPMGCVILGEKNCVHLPSVGEQTAN